MKAIVLFIGFVVAVELFLIIRGTMRVRSEAEAGQCGDCILVLCHFLLPSGEFREEFLERLAAAERIAKRFPHLSILVNGGQTLGIPRSHGRAAYEHLMSLGIPAGRIRWGEQGHDTLDELRCARDLMLENGWCAPIAVSNLLHLWQVDTAFSRLGIRCLPVVTRLHDWRPEYVFVRFAILLPTWFDPLGRSWIFRLLRYSRSNVFGQGI